MNVFAEAAATITEVGYDAAGLARVHAVVEVIKPGLPFFLNGFGIDPLDDAQLTRLAMLFAFAMAIQFDCDTKQPLAALN